MPCCVRCWGGPYRFGPSSTCIPRGCISIPYGIPPFSTTFISSALWCWLKPIGFRARIMRSKSSAISSRESVERVGYARFVRDDGSFLRGRFPRDKVVSGKPNGLDLTISRRDGAGGTSSRGWGNGRTVYELVHSSAGDYMLQLTWLGSLKGPALAL